MPSSGKILYYEEPGGPGIRVDSGARGGLDIGIDYDPIIAKLIVHAPNRELAISKMIKALKDYRILGIKTSRRFMIDVLQHPEFRKGCTYTNFIETNLSDRAVDFEEYSGLAAAVSTAALMRKPASTAIAGNMKKETVSPWHSIGTWEIGMRIAE
jgi:acetyl/propionyl-CoA carboxylase alpha subunit